MCFSFYFVNYCSAMSKTTLNAPVAAASDAKLPAAIAPQPTKTCSLNKPFSFMKFFLKKNKKNVAMINATTAKPVTTADKISWFLKYGTNATTKIMRAPAANKM